VAVISDLDLVIDLHKMEAILAAISSHRVVAEVLPICRKVLGWIRQQPPTISEAQVRTELTQVHESAMDWRYDDDLRIKRDLTSTFALFRVLKTGLRK
jgi:hypothetical protein